jgi:hypothetical protein
VQRTQFGYLGIQQTHSIVGAIGSALHTKFNKDAVGDIWKGLVIFSIWNTDNNNCQMEAIGEKCYHDQFSGEGTGCQIKCEIWWGASEYHFMTTSEMMPNGRMKLSGYWVDDDEGVNWLLVGSISIAAEGRTFGDGGLATFIEQYLSAPKGSELRMASYGPQYIETDGGQWSPIEQANFALTETEKSAIYIAAVTDEGRTFSMGEAGPDAVGLDKLENTGDTGTPDGTVLKLTNTPPASTNAELQGFINARNLGKLPQGCSPDVQYCGNYAKDVMDGIEPRNLARFILLILVILCCCAVCFTGFMCCRPEPDCVEYAKPLSAYGRSDSRSLRAGLF